MSLLRVLGSRATGHLRRRRPDDLRRPDPGKPGPEARLRGRLDDLGTARFPVAWCRSTSTPPPRQDGKPRNRMAWRSPRTMLVVLLPLVLLLGMQPGCAPSRGEPASPVDRLTIGAYSVVREAFHDGVLPAFAADWKRRTGRSVT